MQCLSSMLQIDGKIESYIARALRAVQEYGCGGYGAFGGCYGPRTTSSSGVCYDRGKYPSIRDRGRFRPICRGVVRVMGSSAGDESICSRKLLARRFWKGMGLGVEELTLARERDLL